MPAALELPPPTAAPDHGGDGLPPDDWDSGGGGGGDDDGDDSRDEDADDFFAPGRRWVTLATFWHPAEAHIARLRLEAGGVVCVLLDELTAATNVFAIAVGGVKLQVPQSQSEQAARLLNSVRLGGGDGDGPIALARFGRLVDAKAAACVVEAAGLTADVRPLAEAPWRIAGLAGFVARLPPQVRAWVSPTAEVVVAAEDLAAAAASLRRTPFAARLTYAARHCG